MFFFVFFKNSEFQLERPPQVKKARRQFPGLDMNWGLFAFFFKKKGA